MNTFYVFYPTVALVYGRVVGQPDRSFESHFVLQPAAPWNPAFNEPAKLATDDLTLEAMISSSRLVTKIMP
jgi:hypothetical protein